MGIVDKLINDFKIKQDNEYSVKIVYDFDVGIEDSTITEIEEDVKKEIEDIGKFEEVANGIMSLLIPLGIIGKEKYPVTRDDIEPPEISIVDNNKDRKSLEIIIRGKEEKKPGYSPRRKEISSENVRDMLKNISQYRELKNFINFLKTADIDNI